MVRLGKNKNPLLLLADMWEHSDPPGRNFDNWIRTPAWSSFSGLAKHEGGLDKVKSQKDCNWANGDLSGPEMHSTFQMETGTAKWKRLRTGVP